MSPPPLTVMVADEDERRGLLLAGALNASGYKVVAQVGAGAYLPTHVADARPDVILINTDSPSRDTLEQLTTIRRDQPRPVVMFADDEAADTIRAAVHAGVSTYMTRGISATRVEPVIELAIAHFREHQSLRDELAATRATLEDRKLLDQAKGILMRRRGCDEPEAFALIRKAAMDQKKRIGQIARDIIDTSKLLDGRATPPQAGSS